MLKGKFHSHITLKQDCPEDIAKLLAKRAKGKLTTIVLDDGEGRVQTDFMITNHFVTGYKGFETSEDIVSHLEDFCKSGIAPDYVTRLKIEYEPLDKYSEEYFNEILDFKYTEVHIKVLVAKATRETLVKLALRMGWKPSTNPFSVSEEGVVQFINKRWYGVVNISDVIEEVVDIKHPLNVYSQVLETKIECAIYDNNTIIDGWWA